MKMVFRSWSSEPITRLKHQTVRWLLLDINFIYFKPTDNSTVRLIISSWKDFRELTGPDVDFIVQSIKLVGQ